MDGSKPANPEIPEEDSAEDEDPLALARRLIDMARVEEFSEVDLGPLPVLPAPGTENPLELAMQLIYRTRLEDEEKSTETKPTDDDPLGLAIRLLGSVRPEEKSSVDRLAVASQLLEAEEDRRAAAAQAAAAPQEFAGEFAWLNDDLPPPRQEYAGEFAWLNEPSTPATDSGKISALAPPPAEGGSPPVPEPIWAPDQSAPLLLEPAWLPDQSAPLLPEGGLPTIPEQPLAPSWAPDQATPVLPELPSHAPDPTSWAPDLATPLLPELPPVLADLPPAALLPELPAAPAELPPTPLLPELPTVGPQGPEPMASSLAQSGLPTVPADAPAPPSWAPDQAAPLLSEGGLSPAFPLEAPAAPAWANPLGSEVAAEKVELGWTPDQSSPLLPRDALPVLPELTSVPEPPPITSPPVLDAPLPPAPGEIPNLLETPELATSGPAEAPWIPSLATPLLPDLPILEDSVEESALPTIPTQTVAPQPEEPRAPVLSEPMEAPGLPLLKASSLRSEAPADEPDQPRLALPTAEEKADPSELARKLLEEATSEEQADPMALARRLLLDADREEKSDPLALARRLLKDARREEKPTATSSLMGAPIEEGAPPPLFDPAGLGVEHDPLLGAPEPAPVTEGGWSAPDTEDVFAQIESTHAPPVSPPGPVPTATEVWPPPNTESEIEATHAPPNDPPLLIPSATQVWPPPDQGPGRPQLRRPSRQDDSVKMPALRIERSRPLENVAPQAPQADFRLELERPSAKVESTREAGAYPSPPPVAPPSQPQPISQRVHRPAPSIPAGSPKSSREAALVPRVKLGESLGFRIRKLWDRRARIEPNDVVIFTRQFSAMVSAGLQLHQALHFYAQSHDESGMAEVVDDVASRVSQGSSLSAAMRNHPTVFPEVYTGLVSAGEATGLLVSILSKLAELCERNQKLRQRVLAAITYPMVVLVVSILCIGVFIWVVLPMFTPMFTQLGVELPWPTKVLVFISKVGRNPYLMAIAFLLPPALWLSTPLLRRFFGTPSRKRFLDRQLLRLPIIGPMAEKVITARVLFSLASMLDAGIPFTSCLEKCEHVAGNAEVAHRLKLARGLLVEGDSAADCLAAHGVFPSGAIQMIAVGEESAQLSEMIRRVASVYDDDVQLALMDLASMLEPVILLVMGLVVGFIVLASAMPTAQLLQTL